MARRLRLALFALTVTAVLAGFAWSMLRVDPKLRLEQVLSEAFGRSVKIGELQVHALEGRVELADVELGNPPGWAGPPLLFAANVEIDASLESLLAGRVVGTLHASGLDLHVQKRGVETNANGINSVRKPKGRLRELELRVELEGAHVVMEDLDRAQRLEMQGVDLALSLSKDHAGRALEVEVEVAALGFGEVGLEHMYLRGRTLPLGLEVETLEAEIGEQGRVRGRGRVELREGLTWTGSIDLSTVELKQDVLAWLGAFYPTARRVRDVPDAEIPGRLDAHVSVAARGVAWPDVRDSLSAEGWVEVKELAFGPGTLVVQARALAGLGSRPLRVDKVRLSGRIREGWAALGELRIDQESVPLPVQGRVSLQGALELRVELGATSLPAGRLPLTLEWTPRLNIRGTLRHPILE